MRVPHPNLTLPYIQLYANYKQGTGEDFSKATQPGSFAFQVRTIMPRHLLLSLPLLRLHALKLYAADVDSVRIGEVQV